MAKTFRILIVVVSSGLTLPGFAQTVPDPSKAVELDSVVVTATRGDRRLSDLPESVSVVSAEAIAATPAISLDDALRNTPSVDLPIAPSYQLHPTGTAISMRGLGGLRALVLLDGVPLNDPFFGYVQWNRVPVESVERIEVVKGGGAPLWGNYAMGGVINIITKAPEQTGAVLDAAGGSFGTYRGYVGVTAVASDTAKISVDYGKLHTDGFEQTPVQYRSVDSVPTSLTADNMDVTGDFKLTPTLTARARVDYDENFQDLLTRLAINQQRIWTYSGSLSQRFESGTATATFFHDDSHFRTDITGTPAGAPASSAQFVENRHFTPTTDTGGSLLWNQTSTGWFRSLTFGADVHGIAGSDTADIFVPSGAQIRTDVGRGKQLFLGTFAEASVRPIEPLEFLGSVRYQYFENYDGFDGSPGGVGATPDVSKRSVDPRLSIRYALTSEWAVRGAAYSAFRAPNMDNLYRTFSTPSGIFYSNPALKPETLVGGEVGLDFNRPGFRAQVTAYTNTVDDVMTSENLPKSELPAGFKFGSRNINAGSARARGFEAEASWVLSPSLTGTLGYNYADSVITENRLDPESVGLQISGIPRHRVTANISYRGPGGWRITPEVRWISESFGDNDHTLPLGCHFVADIAASYPVNRHIELFLDGQNLFNRSYLSDNNGLQPPRLAPPFTLLAGVHLTFN